MTGSGHAAAPVRLDFAGGWTDVPPYSTREGGVVVAAAIELFAHAEVAPRDAGYRLVSEDMGLALDLADRAALASESRLPCSAPACACSRSGAAR